MQWIAQRRQLALTRDLDGDGRVDVLRREQDRGGSGGASTRVTLCLSSIGKVLSWTWFEDSYSFTLPVPESWSNSQAPSQVNVTPVFVVLQST